MLYGSYHRTETIEEALGHLAGALGSERGKQVRLIAGGTDLMVQLRERLTEADALVDVSSIPALKKIWVESAWCVLSPLRPTNWRATTGCRIEH